MGITKQQDRYMCIVYRYVKRYMCIDMCIDMLKDF